MRSQHDKILKHLRKAGSITVREALVEYSISSLTKRIQELRGRGYNIVSEWKSHPVTGQRYTRYKFDSPQTARRACLGVLSGGDGA